MHQGGNFHCLKNQRRKNLIYVYRNWFYFLQSVLLFNKSEFYFCRYISQSKLVLPILQRKIELSCTLPRILLVLLRMPPLTPHVLLHSLHADQSDTTQSLGQGTVHDSVASGFSKLEQYWLLIVSSLALWQ
jgi:hypothetical protein